MKLFDGTTPGNCTVDEVPADAQLVDVRERFEYDAGHAKGAVNIPRSELARRMKEIDASREVYVICQSGGRSADACAEMARAGLGAINVTGGTVAWHEAGLPIE